MIKLGFRANVFLRVGLLTTLIFAFVISLGQGSLSLTSITLGLLVIGLVIHLVYYVESTNRTLATFLESIKFDDHLTLSMGRQKGATFDQLIGAYSTINHKFLEIRAEKEAQHQFLRTVVSSVNVGLLCVDEEGEVIMLNQALKRLLKKPHLVSLDSLKPIDPALWQAVRILRHGERKLVRLHRKGKIRQLSIEATEIKMREDTYRLIIFQDIQSELEAQEFMAWQKLIRILTHEIMNSVAPISSLSATIDGVLTQAERVEGNELTQLHRSMQVIQRRSENLLQFTETYRNLTRLPPPKFEALPLAELLQQVEELFSAEMAARNIVFSLQAPHESEKIQADKGLIEQVLINLLKNAMEAVEGRSEPNVGIRVRRADEEHTQIQVFDNGPGISPEAMDQIFVPFFTTKESGSGIGLSLCRQIMMMHKGNIEVQSEPGEGTVVSLTL